MKIDDLTALDPSYPPKKYPKGYTTKAMTKYYKRGQRTFYMVSPGKVIRVINKLCVTEVTIATGDDGSKVMMSTGEFIANDALEGTEITREEFAEQFKIAASLIVLDP